MCLHLLVLREEIKPSVHLKFYCSHKHLYIETLLSLTKYGDGSSSFGCDLDLPQT